MATKRNPRLSIALPVLAILALALLLILRPSSAEYLELLRQGDEYAAEAKHTAAVNVYQKAARLRPDEPHPYLRMARVYLDWGRTSEALNAVAEAERLGASTDHVERLRGAIHVARGDWSAVVEHAQQHLTLNPNARETRHYLAQAYVELGEWEAARSEYRTLLQDAPNDAKAHERLGALLLGDDPVAIQHLFTAQTDLANHLITALEEAQANDPAHRSMLAGRVLFEAQEWALAVRQFERAISYRPDYPSAHAYLGYGLDQMGRTAEAESHLQQAVTLAQSSVVAHTLLGMHYERLGALAAARAEYETAYDLDSDNPAICVEIGQTWEAERRYVTAEIWLREAVSLQPNDPALWEILARFYLDHNISIEERAVKATTKLLELSPENPHAYDLRGWAAFQTGDYETAQRYLSQAIALDPTLASAYYHLGMLRIAEGERQEAEKAFIHALDLDTTGELIPLVERAMRMPAGGG